MNTLYIKVTETLYSVIAGELSRTSLKMLACLLVDWCFALPQVGGHSHEA